MRVLQAHSGSPSPAGRRRLRLGWGLLATASTAIGMAALRYAVPQVPLAPQLPNLLAHRAALTLHAVAAGISLIVGPWQFRSGLRTRRPRLHRRLGYAYLGAVGLGGISALWLAPGAAYGLVSAAGFATLALCWLGAAAVALVLIIRGDIAGHRLWMLRCFAMTAAAITLRVMLPLSQAFGIPMARAYPAIAWACWLFNLLCLELWLSFRRRDAVGDQRAAA